MKRRQLRHIAPFTVILLMLISACSSQKNTAYTRWWKAFNTRYNTYFNGSQAYIDGSLEKEQGNKDNFTEIIPLYTVGNKNSKDLGKGNFDRAIEKAEKAIHKYSIKRRPVWDKKRRKTAKDIEWLHRREYNPFIWKAWMLMGRSQFHQGEFEEAASTFSYMSRLYATQPAIYGKARAWLAKCYIEGDMLYDAEDVIRNMKRDSMDWRARKEWDYTYADYYLHTGDWKQAVPYLRKVIRHEMRRKQKAREWYLMGQIQAALGNRDSAYSAFSHVIRLNPPYELSFNAQIARTEVMAQGQSKKMISQLKRMAASDKNKNYLDQVYYAIGNIYLAERDTMRAISAYETGNEKSVRSGIEKGVLLLHLGDLYWAKEKFSDARRCYGEAIGLLDKDRKDYEQLSRRSQVLDELVPYTEAVQLQDSLQALAKMSEADRNKAIDRAIEAYKKKEKEEKRNQQEQDAQQQLQSANRGTVGATQRNTTQQSNQQQSTWYFYNPMAVAQGKENFQRLWGKRENVDNWQRSNKTVVGSSDSQDALTDAQRDSLFKAQAAQDSLKQVMDSAQNDPHKREYYLAQIPFTPEQLDASNAILEDGLYHSGVIFKDKLDKLRLSEKNLLRLVNGYPDYEHIDEAYYHLFLLYQRLGMPAQAEAYVRKLKSEYPKSEWTAILTDPYFVENAKFGAHLEDSLYAATYNAFKADRFNEVFSNAALSSTRFPKGANRDKFIFINGLSRLNAGDADACLKDMNTLVSEFPQSQLSEMAGMIINGVKEGRKLRGGKFDIGDVWSRRSDVLNDSDSIANRTFSNDRNAQFVFMIVYSPDSVNENKLLFELARYNFTNFLVRNFEINIEDDGGLHRMKVSGFRNFDEALQYARQLYRQTTILQNAPKARAIIISEPNLEMLGNPFSYDDYDKFYTKHFAPLKISTFRLLTEPAEITTRKQPEPTVEEIDKVLDSGTFIEDVGTGQPQDNGTYIVPEDEQNKQQDAGVTISPDEIGNAQGKKNEQENGGITIPATSETKKPESGTVITDTEKGNKANTEQPKVPSGITIPDSNVNDKASQENQGGTTVVVPKKQPDTLKPMQQPSQLKGKSADKGVKVPSKSMGTTLPKVKTPTKSATTGANSKTSTTTKKTPVKPKRERTGIYFDDGFGLEEGDTLKTKKNSSKKTTKKKFDLEDEYYDLDGF